MTIGFTSWRSIINSGVRRIEWVPEEGTSQSREITSNITLRISLSPRQLDRVSTGQGFSRFEMKLS